MMSEPKLVDAHSGAKSFISHGHTLSKVQLKQFLRVLAPFAPHITEELWHSIGEKKSIHLEKWPSYDATKLKADTITIAVQIDGKTRGETTLGREAGEAEITRAAREAVASRLEGKRVVREIVVPGRLVNFVLEK